MRKEQGFTLIELLIVVAIIAIIAAIAVPNLLNARMAANETSAIAALRAISSAQVAYSITSPTYGDLEDLKNSGQLDQRFGSGGIINGYVLTESTTAPSFITYPSDQSAPEFGSGIYGYTAQPVSLGSTGRYNYIMAGDWVVRYDTGPCPPGLSSCTFLPTGGKKST